MGPEDTVTNDEKDLIKSLNIKHSHYFDLYFIVVLNWIFLIDFSNNAFF